MKVMVKAWFDNRAWEGTVIGEANNQWLVAPTSGAAVWRRYNDCTPMLPF